MGKAKRLKKDLEGVDKGILEGLARLSTSPDIKYLYSFVKLQKYDILKRHFEYPYSDPLKNALDKARHDGKDEGITLLVSAIKHAGDVLDKLEEDASRKTD